MSRMIRNGQFGEKSVNWAKENSPPFKPPFVMIESQPSHTLTVVSICHSGAEFGPESRQPRNGERIQDSQMQVAQFGGGSRPGRLVLLGSWSRSTQPRPLPSHPTQEKE